MASVTNSVVTLFTQQLLFYSCARSVGVLTQGPCWSHSHTACCTHGGGVHVEFSQVTPLRHLNIWPFFHSKQNHHGGSQEVKGGQNASSEGWTHFAVGSDFFAFPRDPVVAKDFPPNSGVRVLSSALDDQLPWLRSWVERY